MHLKDDVKACRRIFEDLLSNHGVLQEWYLNTDEQEREYFFEHTNKASWISAAFVWGELKILMVIL